MSLKISFVSTKFSVGGFKILGKSSAILGPAIVGEHTACQGPLGAAREYIRSSFCAEHLFLVAKQLPRVSEQRLTSPLIEQCFTSPANTV